MAQRKKKRLYRDDATKAAIIARAQIVGAARAAQELLGNAGLGSMVSMWARRTGVALPKFMYIPRTGEHRRMSDPETPPGLGSGNPEPRQVTVTPPSPPSGKGNVRVAPTERNIAVALALIEGGHPHTVAETFGVTPGHAYQVRQHLAARIAAERGLEYTPPPRSARTRPPKTATTQVSSRRLAEQLAMYEPPTTPVPRVTATPLRDEAEIARERAQNEMLETALRQALRERDAYKLVFEIAQREKDPNR